MTVYAPWVIYFMELEVLFAQDPEVKVVYNEEEKEVKLYVANGRKADALSKLLPTEKTFGNVTIKVTVVPSNDEASETDLLKDAFHGNPALTDVVSLVTPFGNTVTYAVFEAKVVQYPADDMSDPYGNKTTLYQEIAKNVLDGAHLFFCTEPVEIEENIEFELE